MILGYSCEIWDGDENIPLEQKRWSELSEEEQKAANVLGYNEVMWNESRIPGNIILEQ